VDPGSMGRNGEAIEMRKKLAILLSAAVVLPLSPEVQAEEERALRRGVPGGTTSLVA
jgi:hypothetical protein